MYLQAKIKCECDGTPYRVYINDELITERFYTIPESVLRTIKFQDSSGKHYFEPGDVTNVLNLEIADADHYDVKIENVPNHDLSNKKVWIEEVHTQTISFDPDAWEDIGDPVYAGLKGDALERFYQKFPHRR